MKIITKNENETQSLAKKLASFVNFPFVIYLNGNLGIGKTIFAKGFIKSLGFTGIVNSPTFSIIKEYLNIIIPVYHFDFYKIKNAIELESVAINDYIMKTGIILIEWAEKGKTISPKPDLIINFIKKKKYIKIIFYGNTYKGKSVLLNFK